MPRSHSVAPWSDDPSYQWTVALHDPEDPETDGKGHVSYWRGELEDKPVYLEVGSNVLRFTAGNQEGTLENLTADGGPVKVDIPMTGEGIIIGRSTLPELHLDRTASREHVRLRAFQMGVDLTDMGSTNGTTVHTVAEPVHTAQLLQPPQS